MDESSTVSVSSNMTNLLEALTCVICHELFANPMLINCKHTFCSTCLVDLEQNGHTCCPLCRTAITTKISNLVVASLLEQIARTCPCGATYQGNPESHAEQCSKSWRCNDCQRQISVSVTEKHHKLTCTPIQFCRYCDERIALKSILGHENACSKRVNCCGVGYRSGCNALINHQLECTTCPAHPISCQYCLSTFLLKERAAHEANCPKLVTCPNCQQRRSDSIPTKEHDLVCENRWVPCELCQVPIRLQNHRDHQKIIHEGPALVIKRIYWPEKTRQYIADQLIFASFLTQLNIDVRIALNEPKKAPRERGGKSIVYLDTQEDEDKDSWYRDYKHGTCVYSEITELGVYYYSDESGRQRLMIGEEAIRLYGKFSMKNIGTQQGPWAGEGKLEILIQEPIFELPDLDEPDGPPRKITFSYPLYLYADLPNCSNIEILSPEMKLFASVQKEYLTGLRLMKEKQEH
jgi:hypothetical protein